MRVLKRKFRTFKKVRKHLNSVPAWYRDKLDRKHINAVINGDRWYW